MRGRLERLTLARWFGMVVAALLLVSAAGLAAGLVALDRLTVDRRVLVDRIDPAALVAERLRTALLDEETSVRGYALTGEEGFLGPYRRGRREERAASMALARAARDQDLAFLRDELAAARSAADTWRREYAEPSNRAVAIGASRLSPADGKERFDAVRGRLEALEAALARNRAAARQDLNDAAALVRRLLLAGGGLILLSVLVAAGALRATVIAPLSRLAGDVRDVAAGDFSRPLRPSGPREVADVGRDVDAMRARIVAEVAALRRLEADLREKAAELERSNAELEQFAYVASHDLQEPLRKVASFTQMLQRRYQGQLDERADQYIAFAVDGAKRMQDLINDLLAFSRVGREGGALARVDGNALVERAVDNLAKVVEETGAEVQAGDLPEVTGDAGLLTGVFQNLIANAVKFRRDGEPPRVRIEAARANGEWAFSCTDNGIGVDPEYADRIFVIFQRLHTRTDYEGTGIGLAMCRKIIEYHGGRIWLGTPPRDGGSTFCFTLPAAEEAQ